MIRKQLTSVVSVIFLAGCATLDSPDPSNLAAYCMPENAFRLGSQSRAYLGVCPKETEAAFLAGLQRGRALVLNVPQAYPYHQQMQETERLLLAAASDGERERLRTRLRELEWWAIHIMTSPGTYGAGGGRD